MSLEPEHVMEISEERRRRCEHYCPGNAREARATCNHPSREIYSLCDGCGGD